MAMRGTSEHASYNTAMAAIPTFYSSGKLPLDLQLDLEKRLEKGKECIHDTIRDTIQAKCNHSKRVKVLKPKHVTDTLYMPMPFPGPMASMPVYNKSSGDREEYTPGELRIGPKPRSVTLTVDGQVVYKSENDIHSTEDRQ